MNSIDFSAYVVPVITIAVYLIFLMVRGIMPEKVKPFIPLMAGVLGVAFMAWYNFGFSFEIFLTGLASGLAATGADQAIKIPDYVKPQEDADTESGV